MMGTKVSLILGKMVQDMAVRAVQETLPELLLELQLKSPVKSGTFLSQHRIVGVRIEGGKVIGSIINEGDYPEKVEFGWRKTAVNWHMHSGEVFHAKGAETYRRSVLKIKPNLLSRLKGVN